MIANLTDSPTILYNDYPQTWNNTLNYTQATTHYVDGFRDVVIPTITESQYLGDIFFDVPNDYFTFQIINKTDEEIQAEALAKNQAEQDALIQTNTQSQMLAQQQIQAQNYSNDDALNNQCLYPLFEMGVNVTVDERLQDFDNANVLTLYKVVQSHLTQWHPKDIPALFVVVYPDNVIPAWVQPINAETAYPINSKVTHNGFTWQSTINANTTIPEVTVWDYWVKI